MPDSSPPHPGEILNKQFLKPLGITPYRLAKGIGVHVRRISEIIKGNRNITPDTAIRLGLFFEVPARWWLEMQARFDTEGVPRIDELRKVVKPYNKLGDVLVTPKGAHLLRRTEFLNNHLEYIVVSEEILDRLRAQVKESGPRSERKVEIVVYEDGTQALVGRFD